MNLQKIIENSDLKIDKNNIIFDEPMKNHTTFKIGGPAECLIKIQKMNELRQIIEVANKNNIDLTVMGNGSNVLVLDKGIKGIVALNRLDYINIEQDEKKIKVIVGSGTKMMSLANELLKNEVTGFEELSGIPGTIGGAIVMNAGAHGKEMKDIVQEVKCVDYNGKEYKFKNKDMKFEYRNSIFKNKKYIITEVTLLLKQGKTTQIKNKMEEYKKYRREKQPLEYPSAGSTFKRGENYITAKLIDEAGLKGYKIGGAEVSTKHSGFVINKNDATAEDILKLIEYIKTQIKKKFGKEIEMEIEIIGEK